MSNNHKTKIIDLANNTSRLFEKISQYIDDANIVDATNDIMTEIKRNHGEAEMCVFNYKCELSKPGKKITKDEYIMISEIEQYLILIKDLVKKCTILVYGSGDTVPVNRDIMPMQPVKKVNIYDIDVIPMTPKDQSGGFEERIENASESNLSDVIDNLHPSDEPRLDNLIKEKYGGGCGFQMGFVPGKSKHTTQEFENKSEIPTWTGVLFYGAPWCPYSVKFLPVWEELGKSVSKKITQLKLISVNVPHVGSDSTYNKLSEKEKQCIEIAKKAGVKTLPTFVLYNEDKIIVSLSVSNMNAEEIMKKLMTFIS